MPEWCRVVWLNVMERPLISSSPLGIFLSCKSRKVYNRAVEHSQFSLGTQPVFKTNLLTWRFSCRSKIYGLKGLTHVNETFHTEKATLLQCKTKSELRKNSDYLQVMYITFHIFWLLHFIIYIFSKSCVSLLEVESYIFLEKFRFFMVMEE